jgi:hypothetical protein
VGAWEASGMQATVVNATKIMIVGDFNYFLVLDRIGMNIELIPFLFGAAQGNLPTGPARPVRVVEEHLEGALRFGVRRDDGHHLDRTGSAGAGFGLPPFPPAKGERWRKHTLTGRRRSPARARSRRRRRAAKGPSNHVPTVGKPQPGQKVNYSSEQQQQ